MRLLPSRAPSGHDPHEDGARDREAGTPRTACPYPPGTEEAEEWLDGWQDSPAPA
jgi:ribosome modulation factor